ncbi:MAG: hypothetical protein HFJ27_02510, partial [Clostridia bacterium]|nr:hypothetical protein [Clostridia bacterium]
GTIIGDSDVGSLIGKVDQYSGACVLIENCYSKINITARCANGSLIGSGFADAGITINNCYYAGKMTDTDEYKDGGTISGATRC